jgi:hypothetical protein
MDWAWLIAEDACRRRMARQESVGFVVAVAVLWLPIWEPFLSSDGQVCAVGPCRVRALEGLQWRAYRSLLNTTLTQSPGLDYLFVRDYVRQPLGGPTRLAWRNWVLDGGAETG